MSAANTNPTSEVASSGSARMADGDVAQPISGVQPGDVDKIAGMAIVTSFQLTKRKWGIRFQFEPSHVLLIGVNWKAPAIRCALLGLIVWCGRIPPKPVVDKHWIPMKSTDPDSCPRGQIGSPDGSGDSKAG